MPPPGDATFEGFAEASTGKMGPHAVRSRTCRAVTPPLTDACGKPATHVITFGDGDRAAMCHPCTLYYEAMAEERGTRVKVERLGGSHG